VRQIETRTGSPRSFTISIGVHAVAVALLFTITFAPVAIESPAWHVALLAPPHDIPRYVTKIAPPKPRVFHPTISQPRRPEPKIALEAPPVLEIRRAPVSPIELPRIAAPPPAMKTDILAASAPPAPSKIVLQPAGFAAADTHEIAHTRTVAASSGAFDTAEPARATLPRGTLHATAFSEAANAPVQLAKRSIATASFGDAVVEHTETRHTAAPEASTSAVEIQFKPRPLYTAEAQRLKIEGEVQLEIVFEASGKLRVLRVVRGLGYGLDESAIDAARGIRFRAAQSAGAPVDSTAIVHIVFQLAY